MDAELIRATDFVRSGRCPVSFRHLYFTEGRALEACGAVVRVGRRILVDPARFFEYLRTRGSGTGVAPIRRRPPRSA